MVSAPRTHAERIREENDELDRRAARRKRLLLPAAGALLVLALLVYAVVRLTEDDPGPVAISQGGGLLVGTPALVGRPVTFAQYLATNQGGDPARLERVEVPDLPEGVRLLAAGTVDGPARSISPEDGTADALYTALRPVAGTVLPPTPAASPERTVRVVLTVSARRPGTYEIGAIELTYRVGDEEHTVVGGDGFVVCAGQPAPPAEECNLTGPFDG